MDISTWLKNHTAGFIFGVCLTIAASAFAAFTNFAPVIVVDANGNPTSVAATGGTANASAPTLQEGGLYGFFMDLAGNTRTTLGTLLSGEDQTNNLIRTSGGAVRQTAIATNVSTNTTTATSVGFTGNKTFKGTLVCNAGGSTNCGITYTVYGNELNSTTGGEQLCQVIIPTGAATTSGTCPVIQGNFSYFFIITTGVAGTSPSLNVTAMY
jgi:hypothetical protein